MNWRHWWQQRGIAGHRLLAVAQQVWLEALRARLGYLLALYGLVLMLTVVLLPEIAAGQTAGKILLDGCLAATSVLGCVVAAFLGTRLVEREVDRRTILLALAKPLSRSEFILGKHLGLSLVLGALVAGMSLLGAGALVLVGRGTVLWGPVALAALFGWLEAVLMAAVALLLGSFMGSLLATFLTIAVYLTGHISRDLLTIGLQLKSPSWQQLTEGLYLILPDLQRLNLKNLAVYGLVPAPGDLAIDGLYALLYTTLLLCLTVVIFNRREF